MKVIIIICAILSGCLLFTTAAAKTSDERAARELVQQLENKLKLQQSYNDKVANENQSGFDDDDEDDDDDNAALVNEADMMDNQYQDDESSLQDYGDDNDDDDDDDDNDELSFIQEDGDEDSTDEDDTSDESQTASSSWFRRKHRRPSFRIRRPSFRIRRPSFRIRRPSFRIPRPSIIKRIRPSYRKRMIKSIIRFIGNHCSSSITGHPLYIFIKNRYGTSVSSAQSSASSARDAEQQGSNTAIAMSLYDEDEKFYSEMQEALSTAGDDDDDYANMEQFKRLRSQWRSFILNSSLRKLKSFVERHCPGIKNYSFYRKYSKYLGNK